MRNVVFAVPFFKETTLRFVRGLTTLPDVRLGLVTQDPRHLRPAEVDLLLGDPTKAKQKLGWEPKVTFRGLVQMMCDADMALAQQEAR